MIIRTDSAPRRLIPAALGVGLAVVCGCSLGSAADLGGPTEHLHRHVRGVHAGPIIVEDFEPGTYVRAYFLPPWRNRHYFPATGQQPISGRDEVIPAADRDM